MLAKRNWHGGSPDYATSFCGPAGADGAAQQDSRPLRSRGARFRVTSDLYNAVVAKPSQQQVAFPLVNMSRECSTPQSFAPVPISLCFLFSCLVVIKFYFPALRLVAGAYIHAATYWTCRDHRCLPSPCSPVHTFGSHRACHRVQHSHSSSKITARRRSSTSFTCF